jgi:hypothetical protein
MTATVGFIVVLSTRRPTGPSAYGRRGVDVLTLQRDHRIVAVVLAAFGTAEETRVRDHRGELVPVSFSGTADAPEQKVG